MNKRTCLYDRHCQAGALMQPFGGFDMPIQYSSIVAEHNAVRNDCGVFDVSHMGEIMVTGIDAEVFVNHIFSNDIENAGVGKVFYGMMLYPNGGTVDDLLIYKLAQEKFLLVVNASNIDKDYAWLLDAARGNYQINIDNMSEWYGQIAIQGPKSESVVRSVLGLKCKDMDFYTFKIFNLQDEEVLVSRTGYTGEDGFEIYGSHKFIVAQWDKLVGSSKCRPCGLGCRDTLRFEVGLPLYGNELSAAISPIMAGLGMFCKTDKHEFIGKDAVCKQLAAGVEQKIRGIELDGRAVPRHGYVVLKDGKQVGVVTTGYQLISVEKSCAMALVDTHLKLGDRVGIQIRKKIFPGTVVKKKFYEKHYHHISD